jgi:hypothetical protein
MNEPKILTGLRHGTETYKPGDEAAFAAVLTPALHDSLQARGLIEGEWDVSGEGGSTPGAPYPDAFEAVAAIVSGQLGIERHSEEDGQQFIVRLIQERDQARAELDVLKSAPVLQPDTHTPPLVALESLGGDVLESLTAAGYDTLDAVAAASDKDLEALPSIGPATVKKIRELLK